jgi:glycosyltransferase involved in cell wall biosynthesis
MLRSTDWFVACAEAVAHNLIGGHGVAREQVSTHYEFIEPPVADPARAARLRRSFGIPSDALLVGGSGVVIWRKGPDLFVQAAAELVRQAPDLDVHFVWVGGPGYERLPIEQDIAGLGLEGRVHFVGELTDPGDLFSTLDAFCLTSREDPYPLVMLEAASLGVPVVTFANGGAVEFAGPQDDAAARRAAVVPYLDAEAMGATLAELLQDPGARLAMGRRGQRRVLEEHTIEVGAAALHAELMLRTGSGPARVRSLDLAERSRSLSPPTASPPPPAMVGP